jgi:predicted RNase H-like nuclease (RuvC/YqgF family)
VANEPSAPGGKGFWPDWLTPRRAWEFISNVARLERQVQRLEAENRELRSELAEMRNLLTEHEAQLRLLTTFVRDSLTTRLEARIEKLASELVEARKKS